MHCACPGDDHCFNLAINFSPRVTPLTNSVGITIQDSATAALSSGDGTTTALVKS